MEQRSKKDIHNLIRGLSPSLTEKENLKDVSICPSAWFNFITENEKVLRVKLLLSRFTKQTNNKILSIETDQKSFLKINLKKGSIFIEKLQLAEKWINISQFLSGNKLNEKWKHILKQELVEHLKNFISERRLRLFTEKLNFKN